MAEYDAGSAFVAVLPSTRGFAQRLKREMAGVRAEAVTVPVRPDLDRRQLAGLQAALKSLPAVVLDADATAADREIAALRQRMESLASKTVGIDISAADAQREVDSIRSALDRLGRESPDIAVRVDAGAASAALSEVTAETSRLDGRTARVRASADTDGAQSALAATNAEASRLDGRRVTAQVNVDAGRALAGIGSVAAGLWAVSALSVRPRINVDVSGTVAAISKVIALVLTLGGLAGSLGGLIGAVGGIGAAGVVAGAGLGVAVLASLGVGKALSALSAQQEQAGQSAAQSAKQQQQSAAAISGAQDRLADASTKAGQARSDAARDVSRAEADSSRSVSQAQSRVVDAQRDAVSAAQAAQKARADAARSVERAEADAARAISSALAQQVAAQQRLARAQRDARQAQQQLTTAWEQGKRALQDLQDQVDGNALDQRQAALDLKDARKALDEARASGDADQIVRAQLAYDRQLETIDQLNKQTQRLGADNRRAQQAGVAGTDQYRSALDRVRAANEQVGEASRAAGAAAAAVDQARADGAQRVADAQRSGAEQIAAADERAAAAQRSLSDARSGAEQARVEGAQRVADAQEQGARAIAAADAAVIDAQRALTQAMSQTGDAGSAAANKVQAAFAELSPAAAAFALYLFGLKPLLQELSAVAATQFFPPLQAGLAQLVAQAPRIAGIVSLLAGAMGTALGGVLAQLASPFWMGFFQILADASGLLIPALFDSLMRLVGAAAILIVALLPLAPAGLALLDQISALIVILSPFIAQLLGGLIPAASALLSALVPLGPVLAALAPLLGVLGVAFAQVVGAVLTAFAPILVALTPLIETLAVSLAQRLVGAIAALTPMLVGLAEWMSRNPSLVMGLVYAVLAAIPVFNALGWVFSWLFGPVALLRLASLALGVSIGSLMAPIGGALTGLGALLGRLGTASAIMGVAKSMLAGVGQAMGWLARAALAALGPFGMLIAIFGLLFVTNEGFRAAVLGLLVVFAGLIGQVVGALMPAFHALAPVVSTVAGVFAGIASGLATALVPVVHGLAAVLEWLAPVLAPILTIAIGMRLATMAWAAAQSVLNFAMSMNPIARIVLLIALLVGAIVWAYQNVGWFRTAVDALWLGVRTAFSAIGAAALWLWSNVLSPVFSAIGLGARILFAVIYTVLVAPLLIAWNLLSAAAMWLWTNAIQPVFAAIGAFIGWVTNVLVRPAMMAMVLLWQLVVAPAIMWLYNNVVLPIFTAIGAAIRFVWEYIIRPAMQSMVLLWQLVVAPAIMWLYNNVIKPIWDAVGAAIMWVWQNVIDPAFRAVVGGLEFLAQNFTNQTNNIRDIWSRIRGYLAKPINFMIDVVWNKGVVPAWNAVAGLVGLGPIQPLKMIPEARTGGRIDTAGKIHGPGTGTSDSILARVTETDEPIKVSRDEFIVSAAATRRNLPLLTAINGGAEIGGPRPASSALPAFAGGGPVWRGLWDTVRRQFPNARLTSDVRPGDPGYHGKGMAVDVAGSYPMAVGQMKAINQWIGRAYPGSTQLIHYPLTGGGVNLLNGGPHRYNLKTQFEHQDHVHWAQDPAQPGGGGNGGSVWGAISTYFTDKAREAFDGITNPAIEGLRRLIGAPPPRWREAVPALAVKARDTVRDFVFRKAAEQDAAASAAGGGAMMGPVGDGEIFVIRQIADSARARGLGFDGAAIGVATGIVESGLRNLNYGDRDSLGVFQQRPSMGWGTPAQVMNVRYAADKFFNGLIGFDWRAMDPGMAAQRVQRSAFPDRYGQVMGRARDLTRQHGGTFDRGGAAIGRGWMLKDVIRPEQVLDPVETERGYRPLVTIARDLEAGRLAAPAGVSAQQIATMADDRPAQRRELHLHVHGDIHDPMDVDAIYQQLDWRDRTATFS